MECISLADRDIQIESTNPFSKEIEYIGKEIKNGAITNARMVVGRNYSLVMGISVFDCLSKFSGIEFLTIDDDSSNDIIMESRDKAHRVTFSSTLNLDCREPVNEHVVLSSTSRQIHEKIDINAIKAKYAGIYIFGCATQH
ncbi:hypothetical protein LMH73_004775 [Vibrio splendidus]|nr:hypothetical protein [Vibrio splendidus]MCC4882543.1 hypothetical protein [Vibrio splendidus]